MAKRYGHGDGERGVSEIKRGRSGEREKKGGGGGEGGEPGSFWLSRFALFFFIVFVSTRQIKLYICVFSIFFRASVYGGHV